jgi:y4mF family transcriptional regulator
MPAVRTVQDVAAVVRARRRELGWSQAALAGGAGVSRQWVVALESGTAAGCELGKVLAVLDALGIPLLVPESGVDIPDGQQSELSADQQTQVGDEQWSLAEHLRSFRSGGSAQGRGT